MRPSARRSNRPACSCSSSGNRPSPRWSRRVEDYVNRLARSPKEFDRSVRGYRTEIDRFKSNVQRIETEDFPLPSRPQRRVRRDHYRQPTRGAELPFAPLRWRDRGWQGHTWIGLPCSSVQTFRHLDYSTAHAGRKCGRRRVQWQPGLSRSGCADQIIGVRGPVRVALQRQYLLVGRARRGSRPVMRVREHGWGANPRSPPNGTKAGWRAHTLSPTFKRSTIQPCRLPDAQESAILPHMIVTITGYKGGIGKTTTAVHLAAVLQQQAPTVLVDGDLNRSATGWARKRFSAVSGGRRAPSRQGRQRVRAHRDRHCGPPHPRRP